MAIQSTSRRWASRREKGWLCCIGVCTFASSLVAGCAPQSSSEATSQISQAVSTTTTDKPSYLKTDSVLVTFNGATGAATDWISISEQGTSNASYVMYATTGGGVSGTKAFAGVPSGTFVARLHPAGSYSVLSESAPFTMAADASSVGSDHPSYGSGQSVVATFAGAPGDANDWVSVSTAGSAQTSYVAYQYTGATTSGTLTFANLPPGTYVLRLHPHASYMVLAESASFVVTASSANISTDSATYAGGAAVNVTYAGAPGSANDWISISVPGSADASYVTYTYTGGGVSGTKAFNNVPSGTYVARLHPAGSYQTLAESAQFTVAAGSTSVDPVSDYWVSGSSVTVAFSGMPGNATDWVALSPIGSAGTTYVAYAYTGGAASGQVVISGVPAGTYVARAHPTASYNVLAESSRIVVATPSVGTDSSSYAAGAPVHVSFAGATTNPTDWISISLPGSSATSFVAYAYTGGSTNAVHDFANVPAGTYVARLHPAGSYQVLAETSSFTVASNATTVSATASSYGTGADVVVSFTGLPGNLHDWIGLAPVGSAATSVVAWAYTHGASSGQVRLTGVPDGQYVARSHAEAYYDVLAESAQIVVGDPLGATGTSGAAPAGTTTGWAQVSSGAYHTCAITTGGQLWCWGQNSSGQVGDGSTSNRDAPVQVGMGATWAQVSAGYVHSCAVRTDGTLWCWGSNSYSELGDGTSTDYLVPIRVGLASNWSSVAAGGAHSCATRTDNSLYCWGSNADGQLGDGTTATRAVPTHVGSAAWSSVAAGHRHTCGVQTDGSLYCWGGNMQGQLGDGTATWRPSPTRVGSATNWSSVALGHVHSCGVRTDGSLYCWGDNGNGEIGDGTSLDRRTPVQIAAGTTWSRANPGYYVTCGVRTDGTLWCWGGNRNDGSGALRDAPVQVDMGTTWQFVSLGLVHACAPQSDTTLWCWGTNQAGQLGDGTGFNKSAPTSVER